MRKLTDEQKIEIVKKYIQGESSVKLSEQYNVSTRSILNILKVRNIKTRGNNGK
jgi:transposase-like protein